MICFSAGTSCSSKYNNALFNAANEFALSFEISSVAKFPNFSEQ